MQKYSVGRADVSWVLKNEVSKLNRKSGCKSLGKPDLFPAGGARFLPDLNTDPQQLSLKNVSLFVD